MADAPGTFATPQAALAAAVERAGSQAKLGTICGVAQPSVWRWIEHGKALPAEHAIAVEAATGVSRHDLRPDIYPQDAASFDVADHAGPRRANLDDLKAAS